MSKRQQHIDYIQAQLQQITISNGYKTDIGFKVSKGMIVDYNYNDNIPFVFIAETKEINTTNQSNLGPRSTRVDLFYQAVCFYKRAEINPQDFGRVILSDMQKALFAPGQDVMIYYIDSEIDSEDVGVGFVSVIINFKINYLLNFCNT